MRPLLSLLINSNLHPSSKQQTSPEINGWNAVLYNKVSLWLPLLSYQQFVPHAFSDFNLWPRSWREIFFHTKTPRCLLKNEVFCSLEIISDLNICDPLYKQTIRFSCRPWNVFNLHCSVHTCKETVVHVKYEFEDMNVILTVQWVGNCTVCNSIVARRVWIILSCLVFMK